MADGENPNTVTKGISIRVTVASFSSVHIEQLLCNYPSCRAGCICRQMPDCKTLSLTLHEMCHREAWQLESHCKSPK
jgi:hypothetical protein